MYTHLMEKMTSLTFLMILGLVQLTNAQDSELVELYFVDHLTAGMIEQDVFIEKVPGSGEVFRLLPGEKEQYMDAPLFAVATPAKHDPFNAYNAGPYKKGNSLNMTLREWASAKSKASFVCEDGWTSYEASFENLVPNSTYSMWYFYMAKELTTPFPGMLELPMGNRDGSQSVFTTDANGKAKMSFTFDKCLEFGGPQLATGMAVAYHSDGQTYGALPGDFGTVTHVQIFALIPDAEAPTKVGH